MSDPFAVAGADYLEQLLRAAIRAPAAAADPAGGRVVASLMVALVAKGEDERIEPYLSCSPGRRSVYEVTCYDGRPASLVTGLAAGQAIRAAARFAAARTDCTVTVVACDDTGHERCVLVGRGPAATYQFPDAGAVDGPAPGPAEGGASAWRPDPRDAQWVALIERIESLPTTDDVVTSLRDLLRGMTIEIDATAIEDAIHAAMDELPHVATAFSYSSPARALTEAPVVDESAPTEVAEVAVVGDRPFPRGVGLEQPLHMAQCSGTCHQGQGRPLPDQSGDAYRLSTDPHRRTEVSLVQPALGSGLPLPESVGTWASSANRFLLRANAGDCGFEDTARLP